MTVIRTAAVCGAAALFPLATCGEAVAQCSPLVTCELVWVDEFNGTQVDQSKWEFMLGDGSQFGIPGWGNNEEQFYTEDNATVANGVLTITARREQAGGRQYTSSRLRSLNRGDWTYGRFEARARVPTGQGLWPAFWMLPSVPETYGVWAASGEIDIMESIGSQPHRILGTIHYGGTFPDNRSSGNDYLLPPGSATSEFHVYAVEWQPGQIRWYVDDVLYATQSSWFSTGGPYPAPFDVDFHLLLNLAVGGNLPGPADPSVLPQSFVIDYVRVYALEPVVNDGGSAVFDDMEIADPQAVGWFEFNGDQGGGGIAASLGDVPPANGGEASLQVNWNVAGSGFAGGFGRTNPLNLTGLTHFSFWINPDAGQSYRLELNLQDDDNGDSTISTPNDDEFQYTCDVSPTGPCAISGGGWQRVTIPLADFLDDNSFLNGGNGVLDASPDGNGQLINVVIAIIGTQPGPVSFRTDYWSFLTPQDGDGDGVANLDDNCSELANGDQRDTDSDLYGNRCDADLNNDGQINFLDLGLMKARFFGTDADADLDGDGAVNFVDLGLMKARFFGVPGPSGLVD
ncbi:MAG: family 16 glycosylhydrolase [Pseudomonadota bacterium]